MVSARGSLSISLSPFISLEASAEEKVPSCLVQSLRMNGEWPEH